MQFNPFGRLQTRSQTLPSEGISPITIIDGKFKPTKMVDADYLHNSDVFAVINRIASDVAACEFMTDEPFLTVLNQPNNLINDFGFWQTTVTQLLLSGNAYVAINRDMGVPTRLEFIPPSQVTVTLTDSSKDIEYLVNFDDERPQRTYSSHDMLHFRWMAHGTNGYQYIGHSPLESLVSEINIQKYSKSLTTSTLRNAINPGITLTIPQGILDKDAKENIRESFEESTTGENAGRAIVLDQGLQLDTIQINSDVANFLNNNDFMKTQISEAFLVPDSYLNGTGDQQSSLPMIKNLYANTLQLYMHAMTSELSMKFGTDVKLDATSVIDFDHQTLIDNLAKLSTGKSPVLAPETVVQILQQNGVFKL